MLEENVDSLACLTETTRKSAFVDVSQIVITVSTSFEMRIQRFHTCVMSDVMSLRFLGPRSFRLLRQGLDDRFLSCPLKFNQFLIEQLILCV